MLIAIKSRSSAKKNPINLSLFRSFSSTFSSTKHFGKSYSNPFLDILRLSLHVQFSLIKYMLEKRCFTSNLLFLCFGHFIFHIGIIFAGSFGTFYSDSPRSMSPGNCDSCSSCSSCSRWLSLLSVKVIFFNEGSAFRSISCFKE